MKFLSGFTTFICSILTVYYFGKLVFTMRLNTAVNFDKDTYKNLSFYKNTMVFLFLLSFICFFL